MDIRKILRMNAERIVIVHAPTAVSDLIRKSLRTFYIVLIQYIIPYIPPRFAFPGKKSHPIQFPIIGIKPTAVFNIVPYPECTRDQFPVIFFGVFDHVAVAADLYPPKIIGFKT